MRKLKFTFSRQALNQTYISYVRPLLEYSSIVWDGCTEQDKNTLELPQNEAALIVTGLTRSTSIENLYKRMRLGFTCKEKALSKIMLYVQMY